MRRTLVAVVAGAPLFGLLLLPGEGAHQESSEAVAEIMQLKLNRTQEVLEGIVMEDFSSVEAHSLWLSVLSEAAEWNVFETPEYARHSSAFSRAAEALTDSARDLDIDATATAYAEMVLQCVQCHKYVRGVRRASHDRPREGRATAP